LELKTTPRQARAYQLLNGKARSILLDGGARSGKSFIIMAVIYERAQKYPGSRHLVARHCLKHAKDTIWHQTILPILTKTKGWKIHPGDLYASFENDSEIWLGGFDDQDRIEKILGSEYSTIYANEISQISYEAYVMAFSRLAQNIPGCDNKAYLDCNPPSPHHWAHKLFLERREPRSGEVVERPELYARMQMNPRDNVQNLPPNYIEEVLGQLPDRERRRMLKGEWVTPEGLIFYQFDDSMIVEEADVPPVDKFEDFILGVDFGLNPAAVLVGLMGDHVWLLDDWGSFNITAGSMNRELTKKWAKTPWSVAYCDPSGGERLQEIDSSTEADNSVEDGFDALNKKMEDGEFHVSRRCAGWLGEVYDYRRDERGRVQKEGDHYCLDGDTMVETLIGPVAIKDVKAGDYVLTRKGYRTVENAWCSHPSAEILTVEASDGSSLTGTADHPVWSGSAWVPIDALRYADILETASVYRRRASWQRLILLSTKAFRSVGTRILRTGRIGATIARMLGTSPRELKRYIENCGETISERYLQDWRSIIETTIPSITQSRISRLCLMPSTPGNTGLRSGQSAVESGSGRYAISQRLGTEARRGVLGIQNTPRKPMPIGDHYRQSARIAALNMRTGTDQKSPDSVPTNARARGVEGLASTTPRESVRSAALHSRSTNTASSAIARAVAVSSVRRGGEKRAVYNLTVRDAHEYFANGILVSNCDAARYAVYSSVGKGVVLHV
jgi:phage terminase large subunit